jgi:3-methyladenine DNA glycosylase AlkD
MTTGPGAVDEALRWLERKGSARVRAEQRTRYGITAARAWGVPVGTVQQLARRLGHDHALALALWETGWYEARLLAVYVDDPSRVTVAQMDRWMRGFDNWGLCDTACFALFDRTSHAWRKVAPWCRRRGEFGRRAGFALLASLALHDRTTPDEAFRRTLPLIAAAASDDRNFVMKGVSWALRSIGRRTPALARAATALALQLTESPSAAARWVGKDALRDFRQVAAKARRPPARKRSPPR